MPKYRAKTRFSVTVMLDGTNVYVTCDKGKTVDLDEAVADLVNHDGGGKRLVKVAKPPKKDKPPKDTSPAEPTTAQVTKASTR